MDERKCEMNELGTERGGHEEAGQRRDPDRERGVASPDVSQRSLWV